MSRVTTTLEKTGIHNTVDGECTVCHAKESSAGLAFEPTPDGKGYILIGMGQCNLTQIVIGTYQNKDVTAIAAGAFENHASLESVEIGASVTSIGVGAFKNAVKLANITVAASNAYYKDIDGNLYSKDGKTIIRYSIGKSDTSFKLGADVITIAEGAFYGSKLDAITLRDGLRQVERNAFGSCASLKKVYYSSSEQDWTSRVEIAEEGNSALLDATMKYNAEGEIILPPAPIV